MSNKPGTHEPQSLLDVREWKRRTSEEIEKLGYVAFRAKGQADAGLKAMRERILLHQKPADKKVA